jgi:ribosomal protein L40E
MAEVVQAAMRPYGCDVQICYNCNAADAGEKGYMK